MVGRFKNVFILNPRGKIPTFFFRGMKPPARYVEVFIWPIQYQISDIYREAYVEVAGSS
jgi:hypothetical protein